jgi:hypothetical protein
MATQRGGGPEGGDGDTPVGGGCEAGVDGKLAGFDGPQAAKPSDAATRHLAHSLIKED